MTLPHLSAAARQRDTGSIEKGVSVAVFAAGLKTGAVASITLSATVLLLALVTTTAAQDTGSPLTPLVIELSPGQDAASAEAVIRAASASGRPVTVRWGSAAEPSPTTLPAELPRVPQPDELRSELFEKISTGIALGMSGIPTIPAAVRMTLDWVATGAAGTNGSAWGIVVAMLIAAVVALMVRRLLPRGGAFAHGADLRTRTHSASRSALAHLAALGIFVALAVGAHRGLLSLNTPVTEALNALLCVVATVGVSCVIGDWLLSPRQSERRLLNIARPGWHFVMLVVYGTANAIMLATLTLFDRSGASAVAIQSATFLGMSFILVLKLVWFGVGRRDIADAFAGPSPGLIRWSAAHAYPWLLIALAIALWLLGCLAIAGSPVKDWNNTARATQVLEFAVPLAAMGFHALASSFLHRHETEDRPLVAAAFVAGQTLVTGAIWLGGLFIVARLWSNALVGTGAEGLSAGLNNALRLGLGIVAGWSLWTFASAFFRIHLPPEGITAPGSADEEAQVVPASRISTVLPLIRDVALGLVVAVTALLVLSALGLDISPLLAGFGVFGLAISFGSQTLVKDIVSGIFFIAEDAFRVGEYIDTGRLKGTVEHISLRSVRLRHQNGQFHTMPFGQIQSITNFSRDWSVVKFELKFDLGVDVDKLRKTAKRVGLKIMEDPAFAAQILQPLKMQGIQDVTETALVVRFKFTARPGNPSLVQREAIKRLLLACREDGIDLASATSPLRPMPQQAAV